MKLVPYLHFYGDCEAAVHAYMQIFGGEILYISHWNHNNCSDPDMYGKIMHVEFVVGGTQLSASDKLISVQPGQDRTHLMMHMGSKTEAEAAIRALTDGNGHIHTPLQPHPAPDDQGMGCILQDRFGYHWIIECPNPDYRKA